MALSIAVDAKGRVFRKNAQCLILVPIGGYSPIVVSYKPPI